MFWRSLTEIERMGPQLPQTFSPASDPNNASEGSSLKTSCNISIVKPGGRAEAHGAGHSRDVEVRLGIVSKRCHCRPLRQAAQRPRGVQPRQRVQQADAQCRRRFRATHSGDESLLGATMWLTSIRAGRCDSCTSKIYVFQTPAA